MDMSVKLNLSYPAVAPAAADQLTAAPQADSTSTSTNVSPSNSTSASGAGTSSSGKDSDADSEKLKNAVQDIEKFVQSIKRNLEFSIDKSSGTVVVKVIASATGEVVRQIPSEEALKLADSLSTAGSVLFNGEA